MNRAWLVIFIGIVLVGFCAWFFLGGEAVVNYPPKNSTIVAFGDSLVFGQGATSGNDFVSVLGNTLGRPIINLGVSGNTTADGLARLSEVLEHDPGTVILLLGGNDALRRIPEAVTEKNLSDIIESLQAKGAVVVLLGVRGGVLGDARATMYRDLSNRYGLPYLQDVLDGLFGNPRYMADGIHPNDAGYAIIADRVADLFVEYKL